SAHTSNLTAHPFWTLTAYRASAAWVWSSRERSASVVMSVTSPREDDSFPAHGLRSRHGVPRQDREAAARTLGRENGAMSDTFASRFAKVRSDQGPLVWGLDPSKAVLE